MNNIKIWLLSAVLASSISACDTRVATDDGPAQAVPVAKPVAIDPVVKSLIEEASNGLHAYEITKSLTTEVGPRLAGSEAEARARDWALDKFKEVGLSNVRIEPFTMTGWERGIEQAEIVTPNPQPLIITALGGSVGTGENGIIAEIAYFPTFEALENAPETGLDGKIVFISGRMVKAPDGAGYGPANRKRQSGATEAAKRGAIAVVIRSVGTDSHRFPHTGVMRYSETVKKIPIAALSAPDADQLERSLEGGNTVSMKLVMTPKFVGEVQSGNVIGEIPGTERPDEIVLVGAHLDSWDLGTGAIDDGAGVGISLGAAQVIIESGLKPKRTLRVVAFGAEEVGLLGARAYVEAHRDELANHILATESDFGAGPVYSVQAGVKSGRGVIQAMADSMGLPLTDGKTTGGPDIIPMFQEGVPAMRFQQDGTDYFDLHHTPDDTFDKINPDEIAQNTAAFTAMLWIASETEETFR